MPIDSSSRASPVLVRNPSRSPLSRANVGRASSAGFFSGSTATVVARLASNVVIWSLYAGLLALPLVLVVRSRAAASGYRIAATSALLLALWIALIGRAMPILREGHARALALSDPLAIFLTAVGLGWSLDETGRHAEALDLAVATRARIAPFGSMRKIAAE